MRRSVRSTCLFLALVMVMAIPSFATEAVEPKASNFFMGSSVYLCNISGTSFEAWFDVTGLGMMDAIGASFIKIQRSSDSVHWTTVKTCAKENYLYLVDYNNISHAAGVSYTGSGGYYYRAYVQLYARNSTGYGTMDCYSTAIYIPAT